MSRQEAVESRSKRAAKVEGVLSEMRAEVATLKQSIAERDRELAVSKRQLSHQTDRRRALDAAANTAAKQAAHTIARLQDEVVRLRANAGRLASLTDAEIDLRGSVRRGASELAVMSAELQAQERESAAVCNLVRACHAALLVARDERDRRAADAEASTAAAAVQATVLQRAYAADIDVLSGHLREAARSRRATERMAAGRVAGRSAHSGKQQSTHTSLQQSPSPGPSASRSTPVALAAEPASEGGIDLAEEPQAVSVAVPKSECIMERGASTSHVPDSAISGMGPALDSFPVDRATAAAATLAVQAKAVARAARRVATSAQGRHLAAAWRQWCRAVSALHLQECCARRDEQIDFLRSRLNASQATLAARSRAECTRRGADEAVAKRAREMQLQLDVLQRRLRLAESSRTGKPLERPPWRKPNEKEPPPAKHFCAHAAHELPHGQSAGVAEVDAGGRPALSAEAGWANSVLPTPRPSVAVTTAIGGGPCTTWLDMPEATSDGPARLAAARAAVARVLAETEASVRSACRSA